MEINWLQSIFSETSEEYVSHLNPKINDSVSISLRVFKDAPVTKVYMRYLHNGEELVSPMVEVVEQGKFNYYSTSITVKERVLAYSFYICTSDQVYYYNQLGVTDYIENEDFEFKLLVDFQEPTWAKDSIFYQIFVDRFFNGNESNDLIDGEYEYLGYVAKKNEWDNEPLPWSIGGGIDHSGGDLEGVRAKIPYLKSLGVTALYLNPIFSAPSHHKYDCEDYLNVDKHFGGNQALIDLIEELHRNDMRIILDISINHTGDLHRWVKEQSHFYFLKPDGTFQGWNDVPNLYSLNYSHQDLRDQMYRFQHSVLKHWLNTPYNIDGWRFDVGHNTAKMNEVQLSHEVWKEVRQELKSVNPNCFIFAEHWMDSAEYLQGDMWDSIMSYFYFNRPVRKYIGEFDHNVAWKVEFNKATTNNARIFQKEMTTHLAKIPHQIQRLLLNQLGSHDIHRIPNIPNIKRENVLTAIQMLFLFKGIPCIYYGDEIGLDGYIGPFEGCRFNFNWNEEQWDQEIHQTYKDSIKLRQTYPVLMDGSNRFLTQEEDALCYARFNKNEAILFINSQANLNKALDIPIGLLGNVDSILNIHTNDVIPCSSDVITIDIKPLETIILYVTLN